MISRPTVLRMQSLPFSLHLAAIVLYAAAGMAAVGKSYPPGPEFEAASIKQNTSVNARRNLEVTPGGRFVATYTTLRDLVTMAYVLPSGRVRDDSQISGGPAQRSAPPDSGSAGCGGFKLLRPGRLTGHAVTMPLLAVTLPGSVGRIVFDRTGLSGVFDLDLEWTPEQALSSSTGPALPTDGVSIFTAVQEQLGLKLESTKSQLDVLVIDRAEKPTEDQVR